MFSNQKNAFSNNKLHFPTKNCFLEQTTALFQQQAASFFWSKKQVLGPKWAAFWVKKQFLSCRNCSKQLSRCPSPSLSLSLSLSASPPEVCPPPRLVIENRERERGREREKGGRWSWKLEGEAKWVWQATTADFHASLKDSVTHAFCAWLAWQATVPPPCWQAKIQRAWLVWAVRGTASPLAARAVWIRRPKNKKCSAGHCLPTRHKDGMVWHAARWLPRQPQPTRYQPSFACCVSIAR